MLCCLHVVASSSMQCCNSKRCVCIGRGMDARQGSRLVLLNSQGGGQMICFMKFGPLQLYSWTLPPNMLWAHAWLQSCIKCPQCVRCWGCISIIWKWGLSSLVIQSNTPAQIARWPLACPPPCKIIEIELTHASIGRTKNNTATIGHHHGHLSGASS